jgi:hypothetical protein
MVFSREKWCTKKGTLRFLILNFIDHNLKMGSLFSAIPDLYKGTRKGIRLLTNFAYTHSLNVAQFDRYLIRIG